MKLRKVLAGAMALVMVAGALVIAPMETKAAAQTLDDLALVGFWSGHSAGVEIYDGGTYIIEFNTKYDAVGDAALAEQMANDGDDNTNNDAAQNFFDAPFFVFYSGDEAKVNGAGYSEHYVARADLLGWNGSSGATGTCEQANCDWTNGWDPYVAGMAAGTEAKLVVTRTGNTVVAISTIENVGSKYTITLPETVANTDSIYVSLSGQCCSLTDISWTAPSSVELTGAVETLVVEETAQLSATLKTVANTTDTVANAITWTSSDEEVATVDATGKVTAVAPGTVTIKATSGDVYAECTITVAAVFNHITAIDVTTDKTEIKVGNTAQLSVAYTAEDADEEITDSKTVTYTSSDDKIAKVDETGKVTAVAPGTVTITASVLDGTIKDTVEITVPVVKITDIKLTVDKTDLEKGDIVNVVATVNPADTTEDKTITWTSSNEKVATVDANGTVTAVGGGNATITAAIGDIKAEVTFKVTAQETVTDKSKLDDMTIDAFLSAVSDGIKLKKGHTYTITFKATSPNAANNWETPGYVVYESEDGSYVAGTTTELFLCRADVFGWPNGIFDNNTDSATFPAEYTFAKTYPADWAAWLDECKAGTDATLTAKWDGSVITITYEIAGAKTIATMPSTTGTAHVALTGEKTNVTNIEVTDTYVKTITGKGDVNMVLPIVLVLFGGAVVLVASKKRFA